MAERPIAFIASLMPAAQALAALALLALVPAAAVAKTLYVDGSTGNDAVSYAANGPTTPWRTIGRAAWGSTSRGAPNAGEAARAGDVVRIAPGTYVTTATNARFDPAYNPANSGTSASPIRFETTGTVVLTYSSGSGPMIGANTRNHIQWSGFTISETSAPTRSDTGPVTFFNVTGGSIESSTLTGNPNWTTRVGDNYSGVRLEDAADVRVANNVIRDYGGQTGDENHNGVETYRSYPVTIENNHISNCGAGIYMKAVNTSTLAVDRVVIRQNIFESNRTGVRVLRMPMTSARPMLIYQNIFLNWDTAGVWINVFDNGATDPTWIRVFNNTFDGSGGAAIGLYNYSVFKAGTNALFWNNIVYGGSHSVRMDTTDLAANSTKDRFDFENNLYFAWTVGFGDLAGQLRTLQSWKGLNQDAASTSNDPLFVNRAGRDFRLQASSPARTMGRSVHGVGGAAGAVIPAGAYISGQETIGPSTVYTPPTTIPAPSNLRFTSP